MAPTAPTKPKPSTKPGAAGDSRGANGKSEKAPRPKKDKLPAYPGVRDAQGMLTAVPIDWDKKTHAMPKKKEFATDLLFHEFNVATLKSKLASAEKAYEASKATGGLKGETAKNAKMLVKRLARIAELRKELADPGSGMSPEQLKALLIGAGFGDMVGEPAAEVAGASAEPAE